MTTGGDAGRGRRVLGLATGMFMLVLVGTVLQQLSTGTPPTVWHWLLLIVGGCLLAIAATLPRWRWRRPDPEKVRWRRVLAWLSIALVVVVAGGVIVIFVRDPYGPVMVELRGCPRPVELRVAASPESLAPFQQVADAYERWTAADHRGCQTVNLFVYAVPFDGGGAGLLTSLPGGWPDEQALIRWPRPDVWLADAGFEVARLRAELTGELVRLAEQREIGWTPVVVGVPATAAEVLADRRTELGWLQVLGFTADNRDVRLELVRPDPYASVVGKAAITPIYANEELDHGEIERRIAESLDKGAYPQGDEPAVLCRHRQRDDHATAPTAVVVSEQAMIRFNQGHSLGADCVPPGADGGVAAGDLAEQPALIAIYPTDTVVLRRQFVRLDWTDSAGPQDRAAMEFGAWLDSADGGELLQQVGLRSDHVPLGDPIGEDWGAMPFGTWREPDHETVAGDLIDYQDANRPGRVLVLLDTSGSMAEPVDRASSRFDQATDAVLSTLDRMTTDDEFGLWGFPDDGQGDAVRRLVPVGAGDDLDERRQLTEAALGTVTVEGGTPLFDALAEALLEVGPTTDQLVTAVVVITDGDDTDSRTGAGDLVGEVSREDSPRVFVIATGAATCDRELREITAASGGLCRVATADSLDGTLADFVGVLWGGDSE